MGTLLLACGAPLGARTLAEERKTVSVLFVDLVAFTARSDATDPEGVRATVQPYHERVREELGRFGGTVEKFVGEARDSFSSLGVRASLADVATG